MHLAMPLLLALVLLAPTTAHALSCRDVAGMVEDGVPMEAIIERMTASSGRRPTLRERMRAVARLEALLARGACPEVASGLQIALAERLFEIGLYADAHRHALSLVQRGHNAEPQFRAGLSLMVRIADLTGDDSDLARIVDRVPPELWPVEALDHLSYLMALKCVDAGRLAEGVKFFEQVDPARDPRRYRLAQFHLAVVHAERGKLKSAITAFRTIADDDWVDSSELPRPPLEPGRLPLRTDFQAELTASRELVR